MSADCCREYNFSGFNAQSMAVPGFSDRSRILIVTWFLFTVTLTVDVRVENKENQWMGVTVQSQGPGGKIVVRQLMDH